MSRRGWVSARFAYLTTIPSPRNRFRYARARRHGDTDYSAIGDADAQRQSREYGYRSRRRSAGDVRGTGVVHSEYNDGDETLKLFQIWIETKSTIPPRYDQKEIRVVDNALTLLAGPLGSSAPLGINQDAYVYEGRLDGKHPLEYSLMKEGDGVYVFVIEGEAVVADVALKERDAVGVTDISKFSIESTGAARILLLEVPMGVGL